MSLIRSSGTKPERAMARALRRAGLRYRGQANLPGTPDFMLRDARVAIFVDGTFFHGRGFEALKPKLKPFWRDKIASNMRRDRRVDNALKLAGWSVLRFWETDVLRRSDRCVAKIRRKICQFTSSRDQNM